MNRALPILLALEFALSGMVCAQLPDGTITGRITDQSGAAISGARVIVTNKKTGVKRAVVVSETADFSASALLPGTYEVAAEAMGFKHLAQEIIVETGSITSITLAMEVGPASEQLTVQAAVPQISYESHEISGIVTPGCMVPIRIC